MKKCPECGNPSYDGAPVCGNCGYKFQMKKNKAPKREDIFQKPKKPKKKSSDNESVIEIINQNYRCNINCYNNCNLWNCPYRFKYKKFY